MEKAVESYFAYLENKRNASLNTIQSYRCDIKKYAEHLESLNFQSVLHAKTTDILEYLYQIQQNGVSASTASRVLSSLKSMYKYLFANNYIDTDPTYGIHGFKAEKKMPSSLTEFQIEVLLSMPKQDSIKGCRDRAMLELLYATGMRVSDLLKLKISDVNLSVGYIYCFSSNSKERVIPIYSYARDCVADYLDMRADIPNSDKTDILFLNLNGSPLSRQGVWKMIKYYQKQSGLSGDITPHVLRHTFAVHLLENGADLKSVKEMMGHSNIASTEVYEQVIRNKINEVYSNAHPRSKIKNTDLD